MILTYKVKHERDFSKELSLAHKVAEYALTADSWSSAQVKHIGLKSIISCQILKKYSRKGIKRINKVKLTIPNQGIKIKDDKIWIPCVNLKLPIYFQKPFKKINQIEIGPVYAYISVSYDEPQIQKSERTIGIDRNTTHHVLVASCPETGKIKKLGKECHHIHNKYKHMRKNLQKKGKYKKVKQIRNKENRKVKDINHKITKALVEHAKDNKACLVMEDLKGIRKNNKKTSKKNRYSLNSWSFYQQQLMIEYKAKKLGVGIVYVEPRYTSQRCSRCGHIERENRKGNLFQCKKCGTVEDSGVNAGFNIAYLHQKGIPRFNADRDVLKGSIDTPKEATV